MTYIKKMVMQGFKSFAKKTEVNFDKGMNVVVGPNGSGKSNISDALCFALGRLSMKSMRTAKAKNLLFMGTKIMKPSKEASVELVFDNSARTFNLPSQEISLKRIVRHNGQSIYKINDETKTRGEVIETLAQAGIDPYGYNLILQGQIQAIVKMHPEERRRILEEVAGISIYESRKEKSLKELDKTDQRLKEISAILRERTSFLKNLEKERAQALRHKELEVTIKKCKASLLNKKLQDKEKELKSIKNSVEAKTNQKDKSKKQSEDLSEKINNLNSRVENINKHIQKSSGLEQETLRETIANLRAELEGLRVRRENYENRHAEIENRIAQIESSIPEYEKEVNHLREESPQVAKKQEELKKKKEELTKLEEEKKQIYSIKTEFSSIKERLREKESQTSRVVAESDALLKQVEELAIDLKHDDHESCKVTINKLQESLEKLQIDLEKLAKTELQSTKNIASAETQIETAKSHKSNVENIDTCPICQTKLTEEHINHVIKDSDEKTKEAKSLLEESQKEIESIKKEKSKISETIDKIKSQISHAQKELSHHSSIKEKQGFIKKLLSQESILKEEIKSLENKKTSLEQKTLDASQIEHQYNTKLREIEEISSRTEKDLDTTLLYKERELENMRDIVKNSKNDLESVSTEIEELDSSIDTKEKQLTIKEKEEQKLNEKFKKLFEERDVLQKQIQDENYNLSTIQSEIRQIEEQINYLKIGNAKLDAEKEAIEMELKEFQGIELIKASTQIIEERLQKAQQTIQTLGSINMRALEVYDEIKEEYDRVKEKVDTLETEKQEILKIIEEIDNKKKRTFMKTFRSVNELFSRNFSQLSPKGRAYLEVENKENLFEGGINIVIKLAKGKYFDVTSLSGGEQTLIALSLLFAIQEHKPYHFYIFDEIDAALDKRNSERLSALLKKHVKEGQYVVVTHNDAIIVDSNVLYGVSMHDGVSKVLSLKLD